MNARRQLNLFRVLVAANALLVLLSYLRFPVDQLASAYRLSLPPMGLPGWQWAAANAGVVVLLYGLLGRIGFSFATKLDLMGIYRKWAGWRAWFFDPLRSGLVAGVAMVAVDRVLVFLGQAAPYQHPSFSLALFASAATSIGEEIVFRLFLLSFCGLVLDFLLWRFLGSSVILGIANLLAALAFGAAQLPSVMLAAGVATPLALPIPVLAELFLVNAILGLAAGRRYLKEGLVAAVGVHFWADVVWEIVGPMLSLGM